MLNRNEERKIRRRQVKFNNILMEETGIRGSQEPTKNLMFGNVGLANGLQKESLLELCEPYGAVDNIVLPEGKSYCFVSFKNSHSALEAYQYLQGKCVNWCQDSKILYIIFTEKVPEQEDALKYIIRPPGLILLEDFLSQTEEEILLNCVKWDDGNDNSGRLLKNRRVKHYGYEFRYDTNNVDKDSPLPEDIPAECEIVFQRLKEKYDQALSFDQLTVNRYLPGQGIPPHVDTHSAFEDPILSLSLGSDTVMEFKQPSSKQSCSVLLRQRSLLIMSGEARYAWTHGITPRKTDIIPASSGGLTILRRGTRTSFTFRRVRRKDCDCKYHEYCDSFKKGQLPDDKLIQQLESQHVHQVYEEIANHFSETRHKPWPAILEFVKSLPQGALLLDIGCGNGKYFGYHSGVIEIGCDSSVALCKVCKERGFQVFSCNCLSLPVRSSVMDACICIAVIHHIATEKRRLQALKEIVRVLSKGGRALIYVWAKDQEKHKKSSYLKQNKKNRKEESSEKTVSEDSVDNSNAELKNSGKPNDNSGDQIKFLPSQLPVHTNRTQFEHEDLLVPWKLKPQKQHKQKIDDEGNTPVFYRYYHVFQDNELQDVCKQIPECDVVKYYYDQGNWCILLEKNID